MTISMRTFADADGISGVRICSRCASCGGEWRDDARGVVVGFMVHTCAARDAAYGARRARGRGGDVHGASTRDPGDRAIARARGRAVSRVTTRAWWGGAVRRGVA